MGTNYWLESSNHLGQSSYQMILEDGYSELSLNHPSIGQVAKVGTGTDLPYGCPPWWRRPYMLNASKLFINDAVKSDDVHEWGLKSSEKILSQPEDVGQQLALTFDNEGSVLAVGGKEGKLRVFKWPSMDSILDESNAHASVKDLSFSPDGNFLASVGCSGPGRIWDIASSTPVAALQKVKDLSLCVSVWFTSM
ncbi:SEC12-like protein 2 [Daucus carota subsp. sativus]|uniref:SEC12-like protein 2 n=1 Tax=Daucus carota subsp. sativus TaxID=79200 RepID=UPI0030836CA3